MFFALLVLFSAFLIEGIGTYVSVVGLSALFASNPIIILLAIALDLGKVVAVSFLYKYYKKIGFVMKTYMSIAVIVLMIITSSGAFGYLSGSFQKAIAGTNQDTIVLTALTDEQGRLQKRKEEIDKQIAKLPDNNVRGRTQLMRQFGPEVGRINKRLEEIDKQLPDLKVASIKKDVEVGPIIYIAQAFNTDAEHAVKWVILTIIFVFDPLAISLLLAGNFLLEERRRRLGILNLDDIADDYPLFHEDEDDKAISQHYGHAGRATPSSEKQEPFPDNKVEEWAKNPETWVDAPHGSEEPRIEKVQEAIDTVLAEPFWDDREQYGHQRYQEPHVDQHDHVGIEELGSARHQEQLIDILDHINHEDLGRERSVEPLVDELDHLQHEHLGRHKPVEPEELDIRPALPEETEAEREVILLHDVMPPKVPKSQLETLGEGRSDVTTDEDTRTWLKPLRQVYQNDAPQD